MKKIYRLKQWYSLEDAAKRLSLTFGEIVESRDVLELALDGQLELYWFIRHSTAQKVEPRISTLRIPNDPKEWFSKDLDETNSTLIKTAALQPVEKQTHVANLNGPHCLLLEQCGALEDYFRSHLTNTGGDLTSLDGFFVMDGDGQIWQIMEAFERKYTEKMYPDAPSIFDIRKYYPSVDWPNIAEIGFPKEVLEEFENKLQGQGNGQVQNRERSTLNKLIIAMAVDGYGYDPAASKSPFPKELEGILDRMGLSVSDDTIRKKLREASELMPRDDDTKPN